MKLGTPQDVWSLIMAGEDLRAIRSENRAKINNAANGFPLMSEEDSAKARIDININFGEFADYLLHARRQFESAQFDRPHLYDIKVNDAPQQKADGWAAEITNLVTELVKQNREYRELKNSQISAVVSHGIGPVMWRDRYSVIPDFVSLEDLAVPTDTKCSLTNLSWFAERVLYTEDELGMKAFGPNADPGWKKEAVGKCIKANQDDNYQTTPNYNWFTSPEKMAELYKQNLYLSTTDALPTIPIWHMYHQSEVKGVRCWKLKAIPDMETTGQTTTMGDQFLYDSDRAFAYDLGHILHFQFGDLCNKAPFLYHSVRSLGYMLMEPCFWSNVFKCRLFQHGMENLNPWWKITDPAGAKGRAQKINMHYNAVIPDGVALVPANERHQINQDIINSIQAQTKQLMQDKASAYTQQNDTGTKKEQTAFETMVKLQQVNAATTSLLARWFYYEYFEGIEIYRRLCLRGSPDPLAKKFQKAMEKSKIPKQFLSPDVSTLTVPIPLGSGNPTIAQAEAQQLMAMLPMLSPPAQQKVKHQAVIALTSDPQKADDLVPLGQQNNVSHGQQAAENAFGTLMQGVNVAFDTSIPPQQIIESLLGLLAQKVKLAVTTGNLSTIEDVVGMATVAKALRQQIALFGQDPRMKPQAKKYAQGLSKLENLIKGFGQRLMQQQQAQKQQGDDGEAKNSQLKLQMTALQGAQKLKLNNQKAEQQRQQKTIGFLQDQKRADARTIAEIHRQKAQAEHQNRLKQSFAE